LHKHFPNYIGPSALNLNFNPLPEVACFNRRRCSHQSSSH
jgi:hypothetical protein